MLIAYFFVYYPVGLPFTVYLAFKLQMWTKGIWIGFTASVGTVILIFAVMLSRVSFRT